MALNLCRECGRKVSTEAVTCPQCDALPKTQTGTKSRNMKTKQLFAFFAFALLLATQVQAQSFLANGLVAYYPFNGTANDATGNGNDGIIIGRLGFGTNRFGQANSAIYFNGTSNNFVSTPLTPPSGGSSRTFSVWFNTASASQANRSYINTLGTMISYGEFEGTVGSGMDIGISSGGTLTCDFSIAGLIAAKSWNDGNWHHYVVVNSLSNNLSQIQFYVDGANQTGGSGTDMSVPISTRPTSLIIGTSIRGDINGSAYDYVGALSNLRIYNRALSSDEVMALYAFNDSYGCSTPDRATAIANLNNGAVVGATITDPGCGYIRNPLVLILGGGGNGATASAIASNGVVTDIQITSAGSNYTNTPTIYIYSPLGFQVGLKKAVTPTFTDLLVGTNYQLQLSLDLLNWTNQGSPFTATGPTMVYPQYFDVDNWNQLFARLTVVP